MGSTSKRDPRRKKSAACALTMPATVSAAREASARLQPAFAEGAQIRRPWARSDRKSGTDYLPSVASRGATRALVDRLRLPSQCFQEVIDPAPDALPFHRVL